MSKTKKLHQNNLICRLCLHEDKFKVSLYSDYAIQFEIRTKIKKLLNISIDKEDPYAKHICFQCLANVTAFLNFVNVSRKNQEILQSENESNSETSFFDDPALLTPQEFKRNGATRKRELPVPKLPFEESDSENFFQNPKKSKTIGFASMPNLDSTIKPSGTFPRTCVSEINVATKNPQSTRYNIPQQPLKKEVQTQMTAIPNSVPAEKPLDETFLQRKKRTLSRYDKKFRELRHRLPYSNKF